MERIAAGLRHKYGHALVEVGYMAHLPPLVPEAFARCVAAGATRILVLPYFLHVGLHMHRDIPELLRAEAEKYPQVQVVLGPNLGFDESLVDLVERRIKAANSGDGKDVRACISTQA